MATKLIAPLDLSAADITLARKPGVGYETQFYVSPLLSHEVGNFECGAANSGTYTPDVAEHAALTAAPSALLAVLDTSYNGAANIVLVITGTDNNDVSRTWTATFAPPAHALEQSNIFPKGHAVEAICSADNKVCKTIVSVAVTCNADAKGVKIALFGVPALTSFKQIACKTDMRYATPADIPVGIQCGRDPNAFTKPGEIPELTVSLSAKEPSFSDGLRRYDGIRVTGLAKQVKEGKVDAAHIFFLGLIIKGSANVGESLEPDTIAGDGRYEDLGVVIAGSA